MNVFGRLRDLWRRHPFLVLSAILQRIPGQPVRVEIFRRYQHDGAPGVVRDRPSNLTVHRATPGDLDGLVACCSKRGFFTKRFADNDTCLIARRDGRIVGYEWFSTKPQQVEERFGYIIPIPANVLYAYDAYVTESARGQGVWSHIMAAAGPLMRKSGRQGLIAHIDLGNRESIGAHIRMGFYPVRSYVYLRVFGFSFVHARDRFATADYLS